MGSPEAESQSSDAPLLVGHDAEVVLPVTKDTIGRWPIEDVLGAEVLANARTVVIVRCAKVGSPSSKAEDKPFKSSDPRPRKLTRDRVKLDSDAVAAALAARVNTAVQAAYLPRRLLCIINPKSGGMTGASLFATKAQPVLQAAGAVLEVRETAAQGDATRWAAALDLAAFDGEPNPNPNLKP